jgi:hypothetical protein
MQAEPAGTNLLCASEDMSMRQHISVAEEDPFGQPRKGSLFWAPLENTKALKLGTLSY